MVLRRIIRDQKVLLTSKWHLGIYDWFCRLFSTESTTVSVNTPATCFVSCWSTCRSLMMFHNCWYPLFDKPATVTVLKASLIFVALSLVDQYVEVWCCITITGVSLLIRIKLIPTWKRNHMVGKVWYEITGMQNEFHFAHYNGWKSMLEFKISHVSKRHPRLCCKEENLWIKWMDTPIFLSYFIWRKIWMCHIT